MDTQASEQLRAARGLPVFTFEGDNVGSVEDVFFDIQTRRPAWLAVAVGTLSPRRVLIPVERAQLRDGAVHLPYESPMIKGAPHVALDEITPEQEQELYAYYGVQERAEVTESLRLAEVQRQQTGQEVRPARTVTRHEEELEVSKESVEAGSVRVVKRVETEPVEVDVELQRETARVVREPVDEEVAEAAFVEEEIEVTLTEERPVVTKRTVAKERVGLAKDVVTTHEVVQEQVRKERIDVEGDVDKV